MLRSELPDQTDTSGVTGQLYLQTVFGIIGLPTIVVVKVLNSGHKVVGPSVLKTGANGPPDVSTAVAMSFR